MRDRVDQLALEAIELLEAKVRRLQLGGAIPHAGLELLVEAAKRLLGLSPHAHLACQALVGLDKLGPFGLKARRHLIERVSQLSQLVGPFQAQGRGFGAVRELLGRLHQAGNPLGQGLLEEEPKHEAEQSQQGADHERAHPLIVEGLALQVAQVELQDEGILARRGEAGGGGRQVHGKNRQHRVSIVRKLDLARHGLEGLRHERTQGNRERLAQGLLALLEARRVKNPLSLRVDQHRQVEVGAGGRQAKDQIGPLLRTLPELVLHHARQQVPQERSATRHLLFQLMVGLRDRLAERQQGHEQAKAEQGERNRQTNRQGIPHGPSRLTRRSSSTTSE
ncbi:hypothetical protein D3C86_1127540 [compost metagenome]